MTEGNKTTAKNPHEEPIGDLLEQADEDIGLDLMSGDIWSPLNSGKQGRELDDYIEDIKAGARVAIDQSIDILTPWFFSNMPQFYYQTTPREEKVRDLHAIITGHIFESKQKLQLWNRDRSKTTFLAPGNDESIILDVAKSIQYFGVKHGALFTSNDRLLLISSFFTSVFEPVDLKNKKSKQKIQRAKKMLASEDETKVSDFLENLDNDMVIHATEGRLARLYKLYDRTVDREDVTTNLIPDYFHEYARLDIVVKKVPINACLFSIFSLMDRYSFQVNRCVCATVGQHTDSPISILTFIMRQRNGERIHKKYVPYLKLNKAVKSLRWVDIDNFDTLWIDPSNVEVYSINEINLIRAIAVWCQIFLSKRNPYYYSEERVRKTFKNQTELLRELVNFFKLRFDPRVSSEQRESAADAAAKLRDNIAEVAGRIEKDIFKEAMNFLQNILRTNYFYPRKTGLSFRMDPAVLNAEHYPNKPYGFFYLIGRGYRGFQVRYRDTARGGLRIVMPRDSTQYEAAFAGLFDEVAGLSYAQQLKNKDIPEGGAKAVVLLNPDADRETAAIGAVDSILNLITVNPETNQLDPSIIDYYNGDEYIYLGPDENVTNNLIDAFVGLASHQGYLFANAFMSSKPLAGINHKEFGVTSEGVNVFLDNMLHELGINPKKDRFTVKMTGGPDGDVAGNELRILRREYGENARVIAIADGLGAAYDPEGLQWDELIRLVEESKSISEFNAEMLSGHADAFVIPADTAEHMKTRNNLHADVPADILIPAGGRPYTVNADNWSRYLDENGQPRVKGIVEGANIFFTESARDHLQKHGVLIFKDSSANKCGVICSSFEILSSLILTPDEFREIKPVYVEQVLEKLRHKADLEAKLLLREYHARGRKVNLVELSKVLSDIINRVTDLVSTSLDELPEEEFRTDLSNHIILGYVPTVLAEKYADRILDQIPRSYRQAIVSADTAARIVYAEGINFFEHLADEDVVKTIQIYLSKERKLVRLIKAVEDAEMDHKEDIMKILSVAGARTLTMLKRNL